MKKNRVWFFVIVIQALFSSAILAVGYLKTDKINIFITPQVTFDLSREEFTYSYDIQSLPSSEQNICQIQFLTDQDSSYLPPPYGWFIKKHLSHPKLKPRDPRMHPNRYGWWSNFAKDDPRGKQPVGDIDDEKPSPNDIPPGGTLKGLSIKSNSLPGMINSYTEGWVPMPSRKDLTLEEELNPPKLLDLALKKVTIGPVAVADSTINGLIDRLIGLKDQCPGLGWITNQGIVNSLNVKLKAAKESISKGKNKTAKNQLTAFINELNAQRGKFVNDSAYALLKANAEYLIYRLSD